MWEGEERAVNVKYKYDLDFRKKIVGGNLKNVPKVQI